MNKSFEILKRFSTFGFNAAIQAVIASAMTALPFLRLPVLKQSFSWIVNWVSQKLFQHFLDSLEQTMVEIEVEAERKAYNKAQEILKSLILTPNPNPQEVANAKAEFEKRLADLVRFHP